VTGRARALIRPRIRCPSCWRVSYHPVDVVERFCPACGFHDDLLPAHILSRALTDDAVEALRILARSREEHLQTCKDAALALDDPIRAWVHFATELRRHPGTANHEMLIFGWQVFVRAATSRGVIAIDDLLDSFE